MNRVILRLIYIKYELLHHIKWAKYLELILVVCCLNTKTNEIVRDNWSLVEREKKVNLKVINFLLCRGI